MRSVIAVNDIYADFSGVIKDYDVLVNKPTIDGQEVAGDIGGKIREIIGQEAPSDHNHDDRYYTDEETDVLLAEKSDVGHEHNEYAKKTEIPTVPTKVSEFTNDADYVNLTQLNASLSGKSDVSHTHTDFAKKTDIPVMPTKVSAFNNDAGYVTKDEIENYVPSGDAGQDGKDGVSPIITVTDVNGGYKLDIKDAEGTKSFTVYDGEKGEPGIPGEKGDKGDPGEDGITPVRGVDYWTEADKAEIKSYVDEVILGGEW